VVQSCRRSWEFQVKVHLTYSRSSEVFEVQNSCWIMLNLKCGPELSIYLSFMICTFSRNSMCTWPTLGGEPGLPTSSQCTRLQTVCSISNFKLCVVWGCAKTVSQRCGATTALDKNPLQLRPFAQPLTTQGCFQYEHAINIFIVNCK
jgi:hypothetical protein